MSDPNVNIKKFKKWSKSLSLEDFLPHINLRTRKIIKSHVAKEANIGYSALKKEHGNTALYEIFDAFEKKLISRLVEEGFLPKLDDQSPPEEPTPQGSDEEANQVLTATNSTKCKELEDENYALRNKIKVLEQKLKDSDISNERHRETIQVINEINGVL
ncbi:hypothetical protein CWB58_09850 [Pseudoalteromonas sp. S201]|uniref:hypothetical protein n=1 Tax=Pseudoalteromonas sp. S201 TaxID=579519 RepID=UPI00110CD0C6|nr:hypothetical protein [Pseudoalteromonas sp. S201]TMS93320.1 hypothetical protein CWB58_09850 [Pseudoalteromonas sp. S201]